MESSANLLFEFVDPRRAKRIAWIPPFLNVSVVVISAATVALKLLGYLSTPMDAPVAAVLVVSAFVLLQLQSRNSTIVRRRVARTIGGFVACLGALNLILNIFDWSAGAGGLQDAARMVPITAISFILLGFSLLVYDLNFQRRHPPSHFSAFAFTIVAMLPLIGHLYGAHFVTGVGIFSGMAPETAVCLILLAGSIVLGRLDHDLAAVLISDGPGGFMARRILPVAILFPFLLGLAKVAGERLGFYSEELGTAFVATISIAGFAAFIWFQGLVLERGESRRRSIQRDRDYWAIQNQMRDQFVSMITHDLRSPLTAASAYAQLIKRNPSSGDLVSTHADKIIESVARGDRLIADLLDVNRIRAGHSIPISVVDCDLSLIVRATMHELETIHGGRFSVECPEEVKGRWDPRAIRRALENLCNNALKYGAPDGRIAVRLSIAPEGVPDRVRLSVHNQGAPIPTEEHVCLFQPFQRASTAGRAKQQGWGIGLALVRAVAEAHGGSAHLLSSREGGTEFSIDLPLPRDGSARRAS